MGRTLLRCVQKYLVHSRRKLSALSNSTRMGWVGVVNKTGEGSGGLVCLQWESGVDTFAWPAHGQVLASDPRSQGAMAGFWEIVVQTSAYMEPGYKVRMLEVTCVLSAVLTQLIGLQKNGRKCLGEHSWQHVQFTCKYSHYVWKIGATWGTSRRWGHSASRLWNSRLDTICSSPLRPSYAQLPELHCAISILLKRTSV